MEATGEEMGGNEPRTGLEVQLYNNKPRNGDINEL